MHIFEEHSHGRERVKKSQTLSFRFKIISFLLFVATLFAVTDFLDESVNLPQAIHSQLKYQNIFTRIRSGKIGMLLERMSHTSNLVIR